MCYYIMVIEPSPEMLDLIIKACPGKYQQN